MVEVLKKRGRGRPKKVIEEVINDSDIEVLPGAWEMRMIGSVGMIYASFDTCNQFWVEKRKKTGRVVKVKMTDGEERVVKDVKDATSEAVHIYFPTRFMSKEWLKRGVGAAMKPAPVVEQDGGVRVLSVSSGVVE